MSHLAGIQLRNKVRAIQSMVVHALYSSNFIALVAGNLQKSYFALRRYHKPIGANFPGVLWRINLHSEKSSVGALYPEVFGPRWFEKSAIGQSFLYD